jgi:F0F1-type ATP synthase assembly protein I
VHHSLAAVFVSIGVIVVIVAMLAARRSQQDRLTGVLLGGASGLLFGLVAGLLKLVLAQASQGLGQTITHWTLWALLAIGGWAVVLNQRAYQATRMSLTTPVLNISQVIVAIVFGILVLGEPAGSSLGVVIGEVVGLAAMILGIRKLAAVPEADQNTDADTSSDDVPAVADRD